MLKISKALNAEQTQTYHKLEYTSAAQSYYTQTDTVKGEWQGQLAEKMGLSGEVNAEQFARLTEGQHPQTGEQMVRHRPAGEYTNADGTITKSVEHRAGWDATFSPPKSVSITALVGGDQRIREAHYAAVTVALAELERYTQARIGGNNPAETTGKFIAAKFEHDIARPVDGYSGPQLHTHAVIFNVTERADGSTRALQERALFETQNYATAVYQAELFYRLRNLGYEIEEGRSGAPEIKGYSQGYLDASSLRSQQIRERLDELGLSGAAAAQIAAYYTRDKKELISPEEVLAAHKRIAAEFGNQAEKVIAEAQERALTQKRKPDVQERAREAVGYAKAANFEREAVTDERILMRDAMRHGMGETLSGDVRRAFAARQSKGEFIEVAGEKHDSGRRFTTPETKAAERANVTKMLEGKDAVKPMMTPEKATEQAASQSFLNSSQRTVIEEVLTSRDRIHGLQGLAGTGKTTTLEVIREGAEQSGYAVEGFAPSSKAAAQLRDAGISANTLQSFLVRNDKDRSDPASRHLYMLDESSLASTRQMEAFLNKIGPKDRVLLIGDVKQHQGVDAGKPFEQMQDAGMRTSRLNEIIRQKDHPALLKAVEHLANNETEIGIKLLGEQGRITQIADPKERIAAIAKDYVASPKGTIIVSPDNASRREINQAVRMELQADGTVEKESRQMQTLVQRSDMTGADRAWAAKYQAGDVLQYLKGSKTEGLERGSYATVLSTNARENTVTVRRADGESVTYDPKRLKGVNAYREASQEFAVGDRIQFTTGSRKLGFGNRDLATVTAMEPERVTVRMDGKDKRIVSFDPRQMRHIDHGYAVTSHSSQGLTTDRVLVNIDTEAARSLINKRLAYVAISRAAQDARIYTNDAESLGKRLATNVSKSVAIDLRPLSSADELRRGIDAIDKNKIARGVELLQQQGRIREYADSNHRLAAVTIDYAAQPGRTVVIVPDRAERQELTSLIREELKSKGTLAGESRIVPVLVEQAGNRQKVASYAPGDIIHYKAGSQLEGIGSNSVATVTAVEGKGNVLTVQKTDGQQVSYSPDLHKQMTAESTVYRQERRELAVGERIQLTAPDKEQGIRARDFGAIEQIAETNALTVRLDNGKVVVLDPERARYIEHGYVVDGKKAVAADRVLVSIESASRLTKESAMFAAISHAREDAAIYTSDASALARSPVAPSKLHQTLDALGKNETSQGVEMLQQQGRIREYADTNHRLAAVSMDYAAKGGRTVVVTPDQAERRELTLLIRSELKRNGTLVGESRAMPVLIEQPGSRHTVANYTPGDTIQFRAGSESKGITPDSTARVVAVEAKRNMLTVKKLDGEQVSYQPHLLKQMAAQSTVYREENRELAVGERIQITASSKEQGIRVRDLGTVEKMGDNNVLTVRMDSGKIVELNAQQARHIEHGYVVDGKKAVAAERVLVSMETVPQLTKDSMLFTSISRASQDAAIYTSDGSSLARPRTPLEVHPAKHERGKEQATEQVSSDASREVQPSQAKQQAKNVASDKHLEEVDAWAEQERHYRPLNNTFEPSDSEQFIWKAETGTVQSYQHRKTGRHLHIDSATGQFYDQSRNTISQEEALQQAMRDKHTPLQENEVSQSFIGSVTSKSKAELDNNKGFSL